MDVRRIDGDSARPLVGPRLTGPRRRIGLFTRGASIALAAMLLAPAEPRADRADGRQTQANGLILGNVVDGVTGAAVASATVTLTGPGGRRAVTATSDGRFVFFDLAAGRYSLSASRIGYRAGSFGQERPGALAADISLGPGERRSRVDIPVWKLGTIVGTVADQSGQPLVGVPVRAYELVLAAGREVLTRTGYREVRTDDRGSYRLAGLSPGTALVVSVPCETHSEPRAEAVQTLPAARLTRLRFGESLVSWVGPLPMESGSNGSLAGYRTTFYPNAPDLSGAERIVVTPGMERRADLVLSSVPLGRLTGTVTMTDSPMSDVLVRLSLPTQRSFPHDLDLATSVTDASGRFVIPAIASGSYTLTVLELPIEGGGEVSPRTGTGPIQYSPARLRPWDDDRTLWAQEIVAVDQDATIDVALADGARVTGQLVFDGTSLPPDDEALQRVRVMVERADGRPVAPGVVSPAGTDTNGAFRTIGLPPGRYFVRASAPGGWYFHSATHRGRDVARAPVVLGATDVNDVLVRFVDERTSLAGSVRTPDGRTDPNAMVLVFPAEPALWRDFGYRVPYFSPVAVGPDGRFETGRIAFPPGDYLVVAVPAGLVTPGGWLTTAFMESAAPGAERVSLIAGENTRVDLVTRRIQ